MEGLLSMGPTLSSLYEDTGLDLWFLIYLFYMKEEENLTQRWFEFWFKTRYETDFHPVQLTLIYHIFHEP